MVGWSRQVHVDWIGVIDSLLCILRPQLQVLPQGNVRLRLEARDFINRTGQAIAEPEREGQVRPYLHGVLDVAFVVLSGEVANGRCSRSRQLQVVPVSVIRRVLS